MATVFSFPTTDALSAAVGAHVARLAAAAVQQSGRFTVALSGGSLPQLLAAGLADLPGVDWGRWHVFFADERVVPLDHPDSNYRACKEALFSKVPIPPEQIFPIAVGLPLEDTANHYTSRLRETFGPDCAWPRFDCLLLGMGPDGHTCSLFPNHPLLEERSRWVAPIADSPKPPPQRVTLTYPVLEAAAEVVFVSTGASKADVLHQVLEGDGDWHAVPSKAVRCQGAVVWFVDDAASAKLATVAVRRAP
eukprot:EG_transcript_19914